MTTNTVFFNNWNDMDSAPWSHQPIQLAPELHKAA